MSNSVIGHVDGRVGEGFNQELWITRKSSSQSKVSRDTPFLQPANRFFKCLQDCVMIGVEFRRFDVAKDGVLPFFFSVFKIPLIDIRNDTIIY